MWLFPDRTVNKELVEEWLIGNFSDKYFHQFGAVPRFLKKYLPKGLQELKGIVNTFLPDRDE